jgi:hypothetical protein
MTDQVMMELAKMQTKIRAYEHNEKKHIEQLHLRDEEISQLKKKIDLLELKENMIAKNKSYLELKALKDIEQIKENQKLKEGKNDNQENNSSNRRKK